MKSTSCMRCYPFVAAARVFPSNFLALFLIFCYNASICKKEAAMKHIIIIYDGMADMPIAALGGKTPMEVARKPLFDAMGRDAEVGLVRTIAQGQNPGSDTANLSILGYDPARHYTGRSPIEAVSIGVPMGAQDLTLRCNLVTLSEEENFEDKRMVDYSGGEIGTEEAAQLIDLVQGQLGNDAFTYYAGVQYRHCLLWHGAKPELGALGELTPPHDIIGKRIGDYLPQRPELLDMMRKSYDMLKGNKANATWLWGEGTRPALPPFESLYGMKGSVISAVDLLKGIGLLAGMRAPHVEGATGWIDTNYEGKARIAVSEMKAGRDFVYLHFEATDEAGHRGDLASKILGIELIDQRVLPILLDYLESLDDYALMILPDHPTPIALKTHTADPVPYMMFRKSWCGTGRGVDSVSEKSAAATGNVVEYGPGLMGKFIGS